MKLFCCLILYIFIESCATVKILGVFPSPGYSQFILGEKLMSELANRGHEVTVVSPFEPKNPVKNYKTILVDGYPKEYSSLDQSSINVFTTIIGFYEFARENTVIILADEAVQKLLKSNETFDLVLVEQFGNEAHMGFASHFKAPLISFSSIGLCEWNADLVGNIRLPSIVPVMMTKFTNHMNFWQRVQNTVIYIFDSFYRYFVSYPQQQEILNKYFPESFDLKDLMQKVDLLLMNSDITTTDSNLLTSAIVEIGGFHVTTNELPKDLKTFLDEAKDGAIFFSMGSNLQSKDFPKATIDAILNVFSKLKQKVLWKFENVNIENKPDNLYISKWLPQSDILAHPNVIAFITHSGLLSITEAIYHGVPIIGIPIFGDQKMNMKRIVEKNLGIELPYVDLTEETLSKALVEILENITYTENTKKYSSILKHKPIKPLDLAMYWIEHIIHYKGGSHLKNSAMDLHWFQIYLLDVIVVFIIIFVAIFYIFRFTLRIIIYRNSKVKIKKH